MRVLLGFTPTNEVSCVLSDRVERFFCAVCHGHGRHALWWGGGAPPAARAVVGWAVAARISATTIPSPTIRVLDDPWRLNY